MNFQAALSEFAGLLCVASTALANLAEQKAGRRSRVLDETNILLKETRSIADRLKIIADEMGALAAAAESEA